MSVLIVVLRHRAISHSDLTLIVPRVLAIIAETKKGSLKTAVALGGTMALMAT
jgi:hypothetical protein